MKWIAKHEQAAGWVCLIIAFLIVATAPRLAWAAIPFYLAAGILFISLILRRIRGRKGP